MASAKDISQSTYNYLQQQGGDLNSQAQGRLNNSQDKQHFYNDYADEVYDPLIGGRGGYNPQQQNDIMREDDLQKNKTSDEDLWGNYLTPDEGKAITGNPWAGFDYYDPTKLSQMQADSAGRQRGAVTETGAGMQASIDPTKLRLSEGYGQGLQDTISGEEGQLGAATDRSKLTMDSGLTNRVRMTPEQQQAIITSAGITAGNGYRSLADETDRRSAAAGLDPIGAAAMRARLERSAAGEAGDAMTKARVAASDAAANREMGLEGMRLGAEQQYSNLASRNATTVGQQRLGAQQDTEAKRLGAEEDLSGRQYAAAKDYGSMKLGSEQALQGQDQNVERYDQETGTKLSQEANKNSTDAAKYLSGNRQTVNMANQNTKYQQGFDTNTALANRSKTIADAARADAQEGRGYLREQLGANQNLGQQEANRQVGIMGVQGSGMNQAAQTQLGVESKPTTGDKILGGILGGAGAAAAFFEDGGIVNEPTLAILGENGPEQVTPLNPGPNAKTTPGGMPGGMPGGYGSFGLDQAPGANPMRPDAPNIGPHAKMQQAQRVMSRVGGIAQGIQQGINSGANANRPQMGGPGYRLPFSMPSRQPQPQAGYGQRLGA